MEMIDRTNEFASIRDSSKKVLNLLKDYSPAVAFSVLAVVASALCDICKADKNLIADGFKEAIKALDNGMIQ